jgi:hypothetical protein
MKNAYGTLLALLAVALMLGACQSHPRQTLTRGSRQSLQRPNRSRAIPCSFLLARRMRQRQRGQPRHRGRNPRRLRPRPHPKRRPKR